MKQTIVLLLFGGALAYLLSSYASGYAYNTGNNLTGATGSSGCSCHGSTSSLGTTVELDSAGVLVTSYRGGGSYTIKISATNNTTHTNLSHFGFQLSAVKSANAGTNSAVSAGTWGTLPTYTQVSTTSSCNVVEQTQAIPATTGTGAVGTTYVESIPWTAPVAGTGSVKLYGIINAVNFDGSSARDYSQAATAVTITEATVAAPVASVHIALTTGTNPTCASSSVTFTATPTNGGTAPTYQWKVNGTNVGTNSATYTTTTLATGSVVTCVMTSNLSGVTGSPATSNSITMTINATVTPSVVIATPNHTICAGTSVTFTATPTNGGTPSYQWKVNGTNVGTNSATYTTTTLTNGAVVTCVMTSTATCASPATATSAGITMTVNPTVTPSVSITTPTTTVCTGSSVTFTATPTNGGTPSYQWKVNGTNVGTNSTTYTTTTLTNGAVVTCTMTSTAACASPTTATSNSVTMTISGSVAPSVTISTATTSICPSSSTTFTATPTNGGTTPSYQWKVNGTNAGTNSATFTSTTLTNGAIVTCTMTSNSPCASPTTATSNSLTMTVSTQTPTIIISQHNTTVCSGAPDTFTSVITNGGTTPSYQWKVNGTNAGTNSSTFISSTLTNGQAVTCTMTSSLACASPTTANSNSITVAITSPVTPTVTVNASTSSVCAGVADSFLATGTGLGTSPTYQWQVNGSNAGTNSPAFISSTLTNGASVTCIVTSNAACASPVQVSGHTTVNVVNSPTVTITPSGAMTLCAGDSIQLTASGAATYTWTTSAQTASIWVYQGGTYDVTGHSVGCSSVATAPATMTVDNPTVPTITQNGNVITSSTANGYQWILNNNALSGATGVTYTISQTGSYAVVTQDANGCYAKSINYTFTYVDGIIGVNTDLGVKLYPVPNQGSFIVESTNLSGADLVIYNIYGQKIYQQQLNADRTQVSADLPAAIYFVTVSDGSRTETIKMQVTKE